MDLITSINNVIKSMVIESMLNSMPIFYLRDTVFVFQDKGACTYGVIIGVFAFIISLAFFVADLIFPSISSASKRKKIVMADLGLSGKFYTYCMHVISSRTLQAVLLRVHSKTFFACWSYCIE